MTAYRKTVLIMMFLVMFTYILASFYGVIDRIKLTSYTWHSKVNVSLPNKGIDYGPKSVGDLNNLNVVSDIKYFMNGTYIQESEIKTYNSLNELLFNIKVSNMGNWDYKQGYLLYEVGDVTTILNRTNEDLSTQYIDEIREMVFSHMLKPQRINNLGDSTMVMTSVDNSSKLWVGN